MATMTDICCDVTLGVDTHRDFHVAAALDPLGRLLGTEAFEAASSGYEAVLEWASTFGPLKEAGIEGTGSFGVGLARHAQFAGVVCFEVNRPNRQQRRRHGKSDTADAIAAARAVQAGEADGVPRGNCGHGENLRVLRVALRSAIKARTQAINQFHSLINTAPETLRSKFDGQSRNNKITMAERMRPDSDGCDVVTITKVALHSLARRIRDLDTEINQLTARRDTIVELAAPPEFLNEHGIGPAVATNLLITIGDNPDRIRTEAGFAALCGASPVDASSGRQQRHRLNRGGDRQANNALWTIVMVRLASHQPTRDYMTKSLANGKTKRETIRNLKRYTARHIWRLLQQHPPQLDP